MIRFPFAISEDEAKKICPIKYGDLAAWAKTCGGTMAGNDKKKIGLLVIDYQNTFCVPEGELFVTGAPADTARAVRFVEGNFNNITAIACTMDTHKAFQIFHPGFWVDDAGEHPAPFTVISEADVRGGKWRVAPNVGYAVTGNPAKYNSIQGYALHYVTELARGGRYPLLIWPYHAMLGGVGHALVPLWEKAVFSHAIARGYNTHYETKGGMLPENYSVLRPEVLTGVGGTPFVQKNSAFFEHLLGFDATIVLGQAKSHCVAWTLSDLITEIKAKDAGLLKKIHVVTDCTSSVPGFEKQGDEAFAQFANDVNMITSQTDVLSLV